MSKKNWIILIVSVLVAALVLIPGISYLVRSGAISGVTLSPGSPLEARSQSVASEPAVDATPKPTATATATPSDGKLSGEDQKKLTVLREIFLSRNDNDPRMDSELVRLSPELKKAMFKTYQQLALEKRNERGTIAFLIGREIKTSDDVDFLKGILMEKPCQSLADCSKPAQASTQEDMHLDGMNELTANYPQVMAIRQMVASYRKFNDQGRGNSDAYKILQALREARKSPNAYVAEEAQKALQNIGQSDN
jgi:hypothetical protein